MTSFLTIQNTYHEIQLALFQDTKIIDKVEANKIAASKMLIPLAASLLSKNNLPISQLKFIAASIGPGPFTTLRTVLSSVNGLSFATHVPLIGIDALDAMIQEGKNPNTTAQVVLLNAFNQDVYFAIETTPHDIQKGCMNIAAFLTHLEKTVRQGSLLFRGNGVALHQTLIAQSFGSRAQFPDPIPETASIETVGLMALEHWNQQAGLTQQLLPIYLK